MNDKIYDEYYNKIYYWSLKKMKNREDAKDLLNDIFVQIYTYLSKNIKIRDIDKLIWVIAYNTYKNKIKKIVKDKSLIYDDDILINTQFENNDIDKIIYNDILNDLDKFYFTDKEKECFILYYKNEYNIKEICSIINSTESNVKYYLYSARGKIKERYND